LQWIAEHLANKIYLDFTTNGSRSYIFSLPTAEIQTIQTIFLERPRKFLSHLKARTIASRTIASGVPEKSADFWGALQIVAIVVNFISRVSVFIRAIRGGSRSVGAIRVSFLPLADA
jgi:hypothetical protein